MDDRSSSFGYWGVPSISVLWTLRLGRGQAGDRSRMRTILVRRHMQDPGIVMSRYVMRHRGWRHRFPAAAELEWQPLLS